MKQFIIFLFVIFVSTCIYSQSYFQKTFGSNQSYSFQNFNRTNDNNFVLLSTWYTIKNCDKVHSIYKDDIYIVKIDSTGSVLKETFIISNENKHMVYIDEINTDEYFLLGDICDCSNLWETLGYIKTNSSGDILESKTFDGSFNALCKQAIKSSNNEYIIIADDIVLKVSSSGDTIASNRINIPSDYIRLNLGRIIQNTETKDFLLIGNLDDKYNDDFILICMDEDLNIKWTKYFDIGYSDTALAIALLSDNNILIAGSTRDTVIGHEAYSKAFIWKLTIEGDHIWYKEFGGMSSTLLYSITELPESNDYLVIGSKLSDGYILRIDSSGFIINEAQIGGQESDYFFTQWIKDSLNIYLFGNSKSYSSGDDWDIYLVKADVSGNTGPFTRMPVLLDAESVIVYPNPFIDQIFFRSSNNVEISSIILYNNLGQILYKNSNIKSSYYKLLGTKFQSGLYYYKIRLSNEKYKIGKILKL